jgi:hypothetical protein
MEENHLKPEDQNYENTTQDLVNASLIFGRALGIILKEKQGIVIDVKGDIKFPEEVKKVIVFKFEERVHIHNCHEDLEEGISVNLETDSPEEEI